MGATKLDENLHGNGHYNSKDKVQTNEGRLPEKVFEARESLLTELMKNKNFQSVYHQVVAILVMALVASSFKDYCEGREIRIGVYLLIKSFSDLHVAIFIWLCMLSTSISIIVPLNFWANVRHKFSPKSISLKLWDYMWISILILFYGAYCWVTFYGIEVLNVYYGSSLVLLVELTRLLMKMHAFVRSSVPQMLNYKPHSDKTLPKKEFSKYLYFLFVPTLVYKDEYPRRKTIRWRFVMQCAVESISCMLLISYVIELYFVDTFKEYGTKPLKCNEVLISIFQNMLPSLLIVYATFYIVLHAWQNMFGEMLLFADRMFYKDWWTSTTYPRFYRTWNVVVHDWLYTYVYKDMYEYVIPKNKFAAKLTAICVSALFHEVIIIYTLKIFYPYLFAQFFGLGALYLLVNTSDHFIWHVLFFVGHTLGNNLHFCIYAMEFASRANNPSGAPESFLMRFITFRC